MNWSDDVLAAAYELLPADDALHPEWLSAMSKILSFAATHLSARGGTMSAERCAFFKAHAEDSLGWFAEQADELLGHIAAQGARVAALESELSEARMTNYYDAFKMAERLANDTAAQRNALEQHISELEKSLVNARTELDEAAAAHRSEMRAMMRQVSEATDLAEQRLAERNATQAELDAALARIKPSGQVAEDERKAEFCPGPEGKAALARLAAQAHGYDAIRAALADSYGTDGEPLERVRELLKSEEEARSDARVEREARHRVEAERDAAVADNAALVSACGILLPILRMIDATFSRETTEAVVWHGGPTATVTVGQARALLAVVTEAHPGTALLERLKRLEEAIKDTLHFWPRIIPGTPLMATLSAAHDRLKHALGH